MLCVYINLNTHVCINIYTHITYIHEKILIYIYIILHRWCTICTVPLGYPLRTPSGTGFIVWELLLWFYLQKVKQTVSWDFRFFFSIKNTRLKPHMNRQKRFRFHEDIRKKCVSPTVVDYADTCQTNRWLCRHRVRVVNDSADMVNYLTFKNEKTSDKSNNKLNLILRKCLIFIVLDYTDPLRGHGVGIVVGYLYTNSKLWRFLTDFKGTIRRLRWHPFL